MLHKVVLTFDSVHNILKCDHSNKSYWVVLCCGNAVIQCLTKLFFVNFFSVLGSGSLKGKNVMLAHTSNVKVSEYKWREVSTSEGKQYKWRKVSTNEKKVSTSEGKCVLAEVGALISWCIYSYRIVMLLVSYMWASMTFLPYMWVSMTFWPS